MINLGFFLTSFFYSFLIVLNYFFIPGDIFILINLLFGIFLFIPLNIKFKYLTSIFIALMCSLNLISSVDNLSFFYDYEIFFIIILLLISIVISRIDIMALIGIFTIFFISIIFIYLFIIVKNIRIINNFNISFNYNYILIFLDIAMLNIIKPKKVKKYIIPLGYILSQLLVFIYSLITNQIFNNYIVDIINPNMILFKVLNMFDELTSYEFLYLYIIPLISIFRISLNILMIKKLNINVIFFIVIIILNLFLKIDFLYLIILGIITYLGGIYGHFRKI